MCTVLNEVVFFEIINEKLTIEVKIIRQQHTFLFQMKGLYVIGVDVFSKQWDFFCVRTCPYLIACQRHEYEQYNLGV